MKCDFQKDKLSGFLDGELQEAERAEVERHVAGCPECRRELSDLKAAAARLRALPRYRAPHAVGAEVARGIAGGAGRWLQISVAAAAVALFAASVMILSKGGREAIDSPIASKPMEQRPSAAREVADAPAERSVAYDAKNSLAEEAKRKQTLDDLAAGAAKPADAAKPEPYVVIVAGIAPAEVGALLKDLGTDHSPEQPRLGDTDHVLDHLVVELTDEEIEVLKKRLEEEDARVTQATAADQTKALVLADELADKMKETDERLAAETNRAGKSGAEGSSTGGEFGRANKRNADADKKQAKGKEDGGERADSEEEKMPAAPAAKDSPPPAQPPRPETLDKGRRAQDGQVAKPDPAKANQKQVRRKVILRFVEPKAPPGKK